MARSGQRQSGQSRRSTSASPGTRPRSRPRGVDNSGIIPILARRVREVEAKAQTGKVGPTNRTKFLVIALLMREDKPMIGVKDGAEFLGVLTPNGVHRALRASVSSEE